MPININNAHKYNIPLDCDFHALPSGTVDRIIQAADADGYRKPRNANGSRARYYHAALARKLKAWRKQEGLD